MKNLTKETIKIYWQNTWRYPWAFILLVFGIVTIEVLGLYLPIIYKDVIDTLAVSSIGDPVSKAQLLGYIYLIGALMFAIWTLHRVCGLAGTHLVSRVMSNLLDTSFTYLHGHSYAFFNNSFIGSLVTKVSRFSRSYEKIFDQLAWNLMPTILTVVLTIIVLYQLDRLFGLILIGWTALFLVLTMGFMRYQLRYDVAVAESESETTGHIADTITNHLNLKLFAATQTETRHFNRITRTLQKTRETAWTLDTVSQGIRGFMMISLEFSVMIIAINFWSAGKLTIGEVSLIQVYLVKITNEIWGLGRYLRKIFEAMADAQEMTEILLEPHEVMNKPGATKLAVKHGEILFDNVSFGYHDKTSILDEFSCKIQPGERVALIGQSGGGKTTIVKLLFRFFDLNSGSIRIDGHDIATVTQDSLREQIALVPQEPILFHRSLLENIRYARPDATVTQVIKAAKLAHCHEFIVRTPEQYETLVGERGVKLSGGERQRIAIARAILKNAPILVLDEATSSLDSESERYIQESLRELMKGRTTIVIAHRLSTIMQMDRIVVIEKGKIVEEGTHSQLLKVKKGTYQKLWQIQAGSFAVE